MAARARRIPVLAVAAIVVMGLALTAVPLPAQSYKVLFDFSSGAQPLGGLFLLENSADLLLLGTTTRGGGGDGTFFTYLPLFNAFNEFAFDATTGTIPASHPFVRLGKTYLRHDVSGRRERRRRPLRAEAQIADCVAAGGRGEL